LFFECPEEQADQSWRKLLQIRSPCREVAMAVGVLAIVLIAPVMVPCCLTMAHLACRRQAAFFAWLQGTHRENVYEKTHPVKLPHFVRQHFEELAPELLDLGFRDLGRYKLKPEPAPSYGYCFQSPDSRTVGVLGAMFDSTYFSFSTLFANGMVLETAPVEETPDLARFNVSGKFRVAFAPNAPVAETYVRHEEEIAAIESEYGTRALAFEPEQFRDVLTYEGRVHSQLLFESGDHTAPPPLPVLPAAVRIESTAPIERAEFDWKSEKLIHADA
jgi:hypothetical protein